MAGSDTGEVITPEAAWRRFPQDQHYSDEDWTTYQGLWTIYNGSGTSDVFRKYHGIRCFQLAGEGGRQLLHKNLISVNLGFGNPLQRPDGFWESNYTYSMDDATYSMSKSHPVTLLQCSTRPLASEAGLQPHQLRRVTVATPNAYLASPVALPPAEIDAADGDPRALSKDTSGSGRSILPAGIWAFEAFLKDGIYRWSIGAVYELPSRRLKQSFLIREYDIRVDPAASLDPDSLPIPDARSGMGDPSAADTHTAGKTCEAVEVRYGADGASRMLPQDETPTQLSAPSDDDGNLLLRYPDGMWALIPELLPAAGSGSGDVILTWGGPMREGLAYQQLQVSYAANTGTLASLHSLAWQ